MKEWLYLDMIVRSAGNFLMHLKQQEVTSTETKSSINALVIDLGTSQVSFI